MISTGTSSILREGRGFRFAAVARARISRFATPPTVSAGSSRRLSHEFFHPRSPRCKSKTIFSDPLCTVPATENVTAFSSSTRAFFSYQNRHSNKREFLLSLSTINFSRCVEIILTLFRLISNLGLKMLGGSCGKLSDQCVPTQASSFYEKCVIGIFCDHRSHVDVCVMAQSNNE